MVEPASSASNGFERLRRLVEAHPFLYGGSPFAVTISVGIAACGGGETVSTATLLQRADEHLLQAKREGRNCLRG